MDGRGADVKTSGSAGLARTGAVLIWLSVAVLLLSMIVLFSYMFLRTGTTLTVDDFSRDPDDIWTTTIDVVDMGSLSITVDSEEPVEIELTVLDSRGRVERTYAQKTPIEKEILMMDGGRYTVEIVMIDDEADISDLEVEIVSTGLEAINICLGSICFLGMFAGIGLTGLIFTILSISRRNSELRPPEILPPWLAGSYRYPPPPAQYHYMPPPSPYYYEGPPVGRQHTPLDGDWGRADHWNRRGGGEW